jgi:non-specific serine/threonine protein kinase
MEQFQAAEQLAARDGLSFSEAMRMLAGAAVTRDDAAAADTDWARVIAGPWLEQTLRVLRAPDGEDVDPGSMLRGTLRPYQKRTQCALAGGPGLGARLADDMGLADDQVLSLLVEKARAAESPPSLLAAPPRCGNRATDRKFASRRL